MPVVTFHADSGAPQLPANWASTANTGPTAQNSYTVIDNLQWTHGRHNIQFGVQVQWLEANDGNPAIGGYSQPVSVRETATLHLTFQFEADVDNLFNSTFYNVNPTNTSAGYWQGIGNTTFGQVSGQNKSIPPRDWQFEGRFRF